MLLSEMTNEGNDEIIPIPSIVTRESWLKIYEFLKHHATHPAKTIHKPIKTRLCTDYISEWDEKWMRSLGSSDLLASVANAADYLGIKHLNEIWACFVSIELKNRS